MPEQSSPNVMNTIAGEYARTIVDLSARLANAAGQVATLGEQNAGLAEQVADLKKKLGELAPPAAAAP